jgi:hypothetical protein
MFAENLQKYAYVMMFINIAFIIVNIAGIFPIAYTVAGYPAIEKMQDEITEIDSKFQKATGSSNPLEYLEAIAFLLINGVQVLLKFLLLIFAGLASIFAMLGVPAVFYIPIVAVVDAIVLYDVGKLLLRLG